MIRMFAPFISEEAISWSSDALRQRMIGEGDTVKLFEKALCEKFGFPDALLLNNGTAGIRLALAHLGVGPGDEVITTPMTCTATNMPILEQFATPVFADIQYDTCNIDPLSIMDKISRKTKAIVVVDWGGYPCDLWEISKIGTNHGIPIIEDAAQALGAIYQAHNIGTYSDFTMFSFQSIKTLTTVDGGLLVFDRAGAYEDIKPRRWFGIDRDKRIPSPTWPGYQFWPQSQVGFKYQPTNVQAAIGMGNLLYFDDLLAHRKKIADYYSRELAHVPGLTLTQQGTDRTSANWLYTVHVQDRSRFHRMMLEKGIETSVCHVRNDIHPVFGPVREDLPALDKFQHTYICIPIHHEVALGDAQYIVETIKHGW